VAAAQPGTDSDGSPTVLRIMLGRRLRQLRESRDISREAAGFQIRASESKISRMETGKVSFKERDIDDLLSLYGVSDQAEREVLLRVARQANSPGWWHRFGDVHPRWFETFLGLEAAASLIRTYEVQFVPGLLQTKDYAEAVIRLGHGGATDDEIARRVSLRIARQRRLEDSKELQLWAVVDEAALRRVLGGPAVMRDQFAALIEAARLPNITLQVVRFGAGGHPAAGGPFTLLRFADRELPDLVYAEQLTSALYIDQREEVDTYLRAMERLSVAADPPDQTLAFLTELRSTFDS
jgi:transcriptional regulator with XRE-family HTH domain